MHLSIVPIIIVVMGIVIFVVIALSPRKSAHRQVRVKPRQPFLSNREQAMYQRLTSAWPEGHVHAQVAMGALITAPTRGERNQFDRKIIDFVLTDRALQVRLVIELDDRSHDTKKEVDLKRDELLTKAGYTIQRFANVPDQAELDALLSALR